MEIKNSRFGAIQESQRLRTQLYGARSGGAFIEILTEDLSVEPASGVDLESIEVVRDCLIEVFKLNSSSSDDQIQPGLLAHFFRSLEAQNQQEPKSDPCHAETSGCPSDTTSTQLTTDGNLSEASKCLKDKSAGTSDVSGVSNDELFWHFCDALERNHFFNATPCGDDDHVQLAKAKCMFDDALREMEKSGSQVEDVKSLAETLKSQGNRAVQSKLYVDAIELYTCAIALSGSNAVYYCNRAAAHTQIHKYAEAIADCKKSIEIDPNYSKAYSRLGIAYYAQGNYSDAINLGYLKALELDPNNNSIRENIRVAEQKLREEFQRRAQEQSTGTSQNQESNNQTTGSSWNYISGTPPFTFSTNIPNIPTDFANIFMNMAPSANVSQSSEERAESATSDNGLNEPEIRIGGNISLNIGEDMPEELGGAWRSMMEMFSSVQGPQRNTDGGSTPN